MMKPLVNGEGKIYIKYDIKGTLTSPDANMVVSKADLKDIVKEGNGDLQMQLKIRRKRKPRKRAQK